MNPVDPAERWFAQAAARSYANFLPCGTAALELAMLAAGVTGDHEVIIPEECCTVLLGSVLRVGARPVLAPVDEACLLTPDGVLSRVTDRTAAVIVVHQWGRRASCAIIKAALPTSITVIEDAASYWDPANAFSPGSDAIVLSFGEEKPLTLGWGGALCADDIRARVMIGLAGPPLFERDEPLVPTAVKPPPLSVLRQAAELASHTLDQRRQLATAIHAQLTESGGGLLGGNDPTHCWQVLPLLLPSATRAETAAATAARYGLTARTLNSRPLPRSPLAVKAGLVAPAVSAFSQLGERLVILQPPTGDRAAERVCRWLDQSAPPTRKDSS